jgi:hypothetical protein
MTKTDTLYMREGTADKQYILAIEAVGMLDGKALHTVTATYGRRGGTLTQQLKTPSPVIWEGDQDLSQNPQREAREGLQTGRGRYAYPVVPPFSAKPSGHRG